MDLVDNEGPAIGVEEQGGVLIGQCAVDQAVQVHFFEAVAEKDVGGGRLADLARPVQSDAC